MNQSRNRQLDRILNGIRGANDLVVDTLGSDSIDALTDCLEELEQRFRHLIQDVEALKVP